MLRRGADVWKGRSVLIFTVRQSKPIVMTSKRRHIFACRHSVTSQMAETLQHRCEHLKSAGRHSTLCVLYMYIRTLASSSAKFLSGHKLC